MNLKAWYKTALRFTKTSSNKFLHGRSILIVNIEFSVFSFSSFYYIKRLPQKSDRRQQRARSDENSSAHLRNYKTTANKNFLQVHQTDAIERPTFVLGLLHLRQ